MDANQPSLPLSMRLAPYKNYIFIGLFCLLLIIAFSMKIGGRKHRHEADYVSATNSLVKWEEVLDKEHDELKNLTALMKKHPELEAQYDAVLAQDFIAVRESKKALEYGEKAIKRTNQPYFSDYAKGSLLVSQQNFAEGLEVALYLKKQMLADDAFWQKGNQIKYFGSGLFAFNLMRIATLYQKLDMKERELEAWHELKSYAGWETTSKDKRIGREGFQSLLSHFSVQDITLLDYIAAREVELSQ